MDRGFSHHCLSSTMQPMIRPGSKENIEEQAPSDAATESLSLLDLLTLIKNREVPNERKIQASFIFVQNEQHSQETSSRKRLRSPPPFIVSLSEWIQTQLSSSCKAHQRHPECCAKKQDFLTGFDEDRMILAHMDERYWVVLKWCLLSARMQWKTVFMSLTIMEAVSCILDEAGIALSRDGLPNSQADLGYGTRSFTAAFFLVLLDVVKLLFTDYGGSFSPKLDLWVSSIRSCVDLSITMCMVRDNLAMYGDGSKTLFQLILFMCRGFAGFSRASPNPRKVFISVVQNLLERLLCSIEHLSVVENEGMDGICAADIRDLQTAIRKILKFSLFHPLHLDGYLNVCKLSKQSRQLPKTAFDPKGTNSSTSMLSYHKLLFQQLDLFIEEGKVSTMGSLAWIFRTYLREIKDQVSLGSTNLYGVKVKLDSRDADKKLINADNSSINLGIDSDHGNIKEKNPEEGSGLFEVFAEFLSPLLRKFEKMCPLLKSEKPENFLTAKLLLNAINNLLVVAIDEQVYSATQDTPSFTNLNYLKTVASIFIHSISTPDLFSLAGPLGHWTEDAACLLTSVLKEVLLGVSHILELEYRVLENDLYSIWTALHSATTLQLTMAKMNRNKCHLNQDVDIAVNLASQILQIFSELRQIDRPILSLCNFLRHHAYPDQHPSLDKPQCRALTSIYLSPRFLRKLAEVMKEIPAGQIATFLGMFKEDLEETLKYGKQAGAFSLNDCCQSGKAAIKALTEISICAIENINVTASNSIQVEVKLKALIDGVIFETLGFLVDSSSIGTNVLATFTNLCASSLVNRVSDFRDNPSATEAALAGITTSSRASATIMLAWEFILRFYVSVRLLWRKCISLMPHKHAKISCLTCHDFVMSIELGEVSQATHFSDREGFFSLAKKGSISIVDFLCGIEQWLWETNQKKVEFLLYTLDCIAMLCLFDVKKQLKIISFLLAERELRNVEKNKDEVYFNDEQAEELVETDKQRAADKSILRRHRKKLKREGSFLANYLTKWIEGVDFGSKSLDESLYWDKVIGSLDKRTLPVARWSLLCQNIDTWSDFASENGLIAFFCLMFRRTLFDSEKGTEISFGCNLSSVTKRLLDSYCFYEQEGIRGLFLHVLSQEIMETLSISKAEFSVDVAVSCIESLSGCLSQEHASASQLYHWGSQNTDGRKLSESSDSDAEIRKIGRCTSLLKLVVKVSKGLSNVSSTESFMSFLTELESSLLSWVLKTHCQGQLDMAKASSATQFKSLQQTLNLLIASRRSLESLILHEDPCAIALKGSSLAAAVLRSTCCMYWPLLSVHAITRCLYDFAIENSDNALLASGTELLMSYVSCTTGLFTFVSQNLFEEFSRSLLLKCNEQLPATRGNPTPESLLNLVNTLGARLGNLADIMKLESSKALTILSRQDTKDSGKEEENCFEKYPFGLLSVLGAISTVLWSFTSALECLDEECHSDKDGNTKWVGQLPDKLLTWILVTERFVIHGLVDLLFTEENVQKTSALNKPDKNCTLKVDKSSALQDVEDGFNHDSDAEMTDDSSVTEIKVSAGNVIPNADDNTFSEPPAVNTTDEQAGTSAEASGHMQELQLSMIKMMLSGKLDTHMWMLGELFMAMAATVKLKSLFHSPNAVNPARELSSQQWTTPMQLHVGVAVGILREVVEMPMPQFSGTSRLTLLAGVLKYLESIGSYLPYARPAISSAAFADLVQLQIVLNGAMLSKSQTVESHKSLVELKNSVQSSFKAFIKNPLGIHFHVALQTIERSLLSVQVRKKGENNNIMACLPPDSIFLGGIECLLCVLDSVSGTKRLRILSKYTKKYLTAIFCFIRKSQHWLDELCCSTIGLGVIKSACHTSARSVKFNNLKIILLKCVEVLIKYSSRKVVFPMRASHLAQAIICPADLFKQSYQRNLQKENFMQTMFTASDWPVSKKCGVLIPDDRMILEIYTACCKLLRNLLKHRTRECGHCIALFGESSRTLLFFLQLMELSFERKQSFSELKKESSEQCAVWLRRVYEEIAEHKKTLGSYIVHFLSDYVCVVSGYGMSIKGLSREVEVALRPGAFALLDVCSTDDLQQLHAVLGEGPRRTTLTALRHDYEQHFKYSGKV